MKHLLATALTASALSLVPAGQATAQDLESDFQSWTAIAIAGPVKEDSRLLFWFDGHARYRDDASDLGVSILRPALGYRVNQDLDVWAGYARVVSRGEGRPDIEEDRFWQQATFSMPSLLGGGMSGRSRLEQRWRETGDDTGWRFRQFVRWAKRIEGTEFSAVVWDELFINLNDADWGQREGFDQNRLFVGGAWHVNERARIEAGYLNHILDTPFEDEQTNHNLSLTLFWSL
ncbi:DUF2490 domain-containing protein [Parvularcula sp. ZS-1/3]|uniref:DUF2490 domain-containing protein n=1 Tax=Parvularcula mediterranea TaxID=2732508 RepID=A0A7Y3W5Z2_9PROT|nr:DUF2490 domain-containing protein [Parvularcula mediterranea]NNU16837.1 DUF2490 domain-containing protein [Parvularcula mediterranea]